MTEERLLRRDEIPLVWEIDRSEVIEHLYSVEAGQLVLRPEFYDMRGWPEGEAEHYTPILLDCFDRGGWFLGLFDQGRLPLPDGLREVPLEQGVEQYRAVNEGTCEKIILVP